MTIWILVLLYGLVQWVQAANHGHRQYLYDWRKARGWWGSRDVETLPKLSGAFSYPISSDDPSKSFGQQNHPVQPPTELQGSSPIQTNKFYMNMLLDSRDLSVWTHPYSLWWNRNGISVSDPGSSTDKIETQPTYMYLAPRVEVLKLGAVEFQENNCHFEVSNPGVLSINAHVFLNNDTTQHIEVPLVCGMGMATTIYHGNLTPQISTATDIANLRPSNTNTNSTSYKYTLEMIDGDKWLVYSTVSLSKTDNKTIRADSQTDGKPLTVQVAHLLQDIDEPVFDSVQGTYPISATVTGVTDGKGKGTYRLNYHSNTKSTNRLLIFALPHHQQAFSRAMLDKRTPLRRRSTVMGEMIGVISPNLEMNEPTPDYIGFYPWSAIGKEDIKYGYTEHDNDLTFDVKASYSPESLTKISQVVKDEIENYRLDDGDAQSMYFSGKSIDKLAMLTFVAKYIAQDDATARKGLEKFEQEFDKYAFNRQAHQLIYDSTWKGLISVAGLNGDRQADFGNTYYNDHHYHYGYFIHAAAVAVFVEKGLNEGGASMLLYKYRHFVDTLVRDVYNPSDNDDFFPVFRNFDWYVGHSWAKGLFASQDGRDEESSSEDYHSVYGMKLWGRVIGDPSMEQRASLMIGVMRRSMNNYMLYTDGNQIVPHEIASNKVSGILLENKVAYTTWFGSQTEYIHGIHMLPITPVSSFIRTPQFVDQEWNQQLKNIIDQVQGGWKGLLMLDLALSEPQPSLKFFEADNFNPQWLDGGQSRAWSLAYGAAFQDRQFHKKETVTSKDGVSDKSGSENGTSGVEQSIPTSAVEQSTPTSGVGQSTPMTGVEQSISTSPVVQPTPLPADGADQLPTNETNLPTATLTPTLTPTLTEKTDGSIPTDITDQPVPPDSADQPVPPDDADQPVPTDPPAATDGIEQPTDEANQPEATNGVDQQPENEANTSTPAAGIVKPVPTSGTDQSPGNVVNQPVPTDGSGKLPTGAVDQTSANEANQPVPTSGDNQPSSTEGVGQPAPTSRADEPPNPANGQPTQTEGVVQLPTTSADQSIPISGTEQSISTSGTDQSVPTEEATNAVPTSAANPLPTDIVDQLPATEPSQSAPTSQVDQLPGVDQVPTSGIDQSVPTTVEPPVPTAVEQPVPTGGAGPEVSQSTPPLNVDQLSASGINQQPASDVHQPVATRGVDQPSGSDISQSIPTGVVDESPTNKVDQLIAEGAFDQSITGTGTVDQQESMASMRPIDQKKPVKGTTSQVEPIIPGREAFGQWQPETPIEEAVGNPYDQFQPEIPAQGSYDQFQSGIPIGYTIDQQGQIVPEEQFQPMIPEGETIHWPMTPEREISRPIIPAVDVVLQPTIPAETDYQWQPMFPNSDAIGQRGKMISDAEAINQWQSTTPKLETSRQWQTEMPGFEPSNEWQPYVPGFETSNQWGPAVSELETNDQWQSVVPGQETDNHWQPIISTEEMDYQWQSATSLETSSQWKPGISVENAVDQGAIDQPGSMISTSRVIDGQMPSEETIYRSPMTPVDQLQPSISPETADQVASTILSEGSIHQTRPMVSIGRFNQSGDGIHKGNQ